MLASCAGARFSYERATGNSPQQLKGLVLVKIPRAPAVRLERHVGEEVVELHLAHELLDAPVVAEHGVEDEQVLLAVVLLLEADY